MSRLSITGCALLTMLSTPALASTTLTFDELTGMTNSPGTAVPVASQVSQQYLSSGVTFSSGAGFVAVVNHEPGNPSAEPSAPNIIGGTNADGTLNYNIPITAAFWYGGDLSQAGVTDYVQVLGDLIAVQGSATLNAYDINGNLIATTTEPDAEQGGLNLTISAAGIHSIQITEQSGTIGYDNFTFDPVTLPAASGVPEPASWALMLTGLGLGGSSVRRTRMRRLAAAMG